MLFFWVTRGGHRVLISIESGNVLVHCVVEGLMYAGMARVIIKKLNILLTILTRYTTMSTDHGWKSLVSDTKSFSKVIQEMSNEKPTCQNMWNNFYQFTGAATQQVFEKLAIPSMAVDLSN